MDKKKGKKATLVGFDNCQTWQDYKAAVTGLMERLGVIDDETTDEEWKVQFEEFLSENKKE